jgi:hypothetical protein
MVAIISHCSTTRKYLTFHEINVKEAQAEKARSRTCHLFSSLNGQLGSIESVRRGSQTHYWCGVVSRHSHFQTARLQVEFSMQSVGEKEPKPSVLCDIVGI